MNLRTIKLKSCSIYASHYTPQTELAGYQKSKGNGKAKIWYRLDFFNLVDMLFILLSRDLLSFIKLCKRLDNLYTFKKKNTLKRAYNKYFINILVYH